MSIEVAIIFFITIYIFSITPGPGVFAILAKSLAESVRPCIAISLGMAVSDVVYLVLASYGLAAIAGQWGILFTLIRIAGAIYLIYLGWKLWRSRAEYIEQDNRLSRASNMAGFIQGFLISASNPKVILFYIAFLPSFVDLASLGTQDFLVVATLTFLGISLGLLTIAASASWARQYFRSEKAMKGLNRLAGSIMMSAGIYLGTR
ncbi:MAG: LysE family translocator [Gammaproteobacteria bacterium]